MKRLISSFALLVCILTVAKSQSTVTLKGIHHFPDGITLPANQTLTFDAGNPDSKYRFYISSSGGNVSMKCGQYFSFVPQRYNTTDNMYGITLGRYTDHTNVYIGHRTDAGRLRLSFYERSATEGDAYVANTSIGGTVFICAGNANPIAMFHLNGLNIKGSIKAKQVTVENTGYWPDFVFADSYNLLPLTEVKQHIEEHKHLPDIPSEAEVKEKGVDLGEMQAKLLQKIEELTLYTIQQQELIDAMQKKIEKLEEKQE